MICQGLVPLGSGNSVTVPDVVMRPILLPVSSVNQTLPSGPDVMPFTVLLTVGIENSVIVPYGSGAAAVDAAEADAGMQSGSQRVAVNRAPRRRVRGFMTPP